MNKQIKQYIILAASGALLGIAMQYFPHLQGEWGENIITFMASDLGCWAVIAVVIATYAKTPLHSGGRCFTFMLSMLTAYYAVNPGSIRQNIPWVILALLMFPIGMLIYWYQIKGWIFIILEVGMAFFLISDVKKFIHKCIDNQMIVYDNRGDAVFVHETLFSLSNYLLLILTSLFGMIFMVWQYRKKAKGTEQ